MMMTGVVIEKARKYPSTLARMITAMKMMVNAKKNGLNLSTNGYTVMDAFVTASNLQ